jgi:hypothetical protein
MKRRKINWENIILLMWTLIKWAFVLAPIVYMVWSVAEVGIHQLNWDYEISPLNLFRLILKGE